MVTCYIIRLQVEFLCKSDQKWWWFFEEGGEIFCCNEPKTANIYEHELIIFWGKASENIFVSCPQSKVSWYNIPRVWKNLSLEPGWQNVISAFKKKRSQKYILFFWEVAPNYVRFQLVRSNLFHKFSPSLFEGIKYRHIFSLCLM